MIIIFWEMMPCGSYKNRLSSTSLCLCKSLQLRSVTCSHSCTLKMEAIRSSETSVVIRATRRNLPEDDNHHSHRRGNLKSYKMKITRCRIRFLFSLLSLFRKKKACCSVSRPAPGVTATQSSRCMASHDAVQHPSRNRSMEKRDRIRN
jgi:hypothetical protein